MNPEKLNELGILLFVRRNQNMNKSEIKYLKDLREERAAEAILTEFLNQQVESWPLATGNFKGLQKVEEKEFQFEGYKVKVQFNPERIRSSAAKVDQKSIQNRACFLCIDKLPEEQKGIAHEDYMILVNPFPIIPQHFTIPKVAHIDQVFMDNFSGMLDLAKQMEGYTLFYNGPKCGASAPDHMHFQAGNKGFMPVESEYEMLKEKQGIALTDDQDLEVHTFNHYLRKMISVASSIAAEAKKAVEICYQEFAKMQAGEKEPMLNVICCYREGKYIVHLFPRQLHRPAQYFAEGEEQLLISPASVDFGGVFITPRREDFEKISAEDIADIFHQVSVDDDFFQQLCTTIKNKL